MAYKSSFDDENPEVELRFLVDVLSGEHDEVDARSRYVIDLATSGPLPRYVLHKAYFPQKQIPLEYRAEKEKIGRLKKISQKKELARSPAGVLCLLTTDPVLDKEEIGRLVSFLNNIHKAGAYRVLYDKENFIVLHMNSDETFITIGDHILANCGLNIIPNKRVTALEALESVPNYYLELSAMDMASAEKIHNQYSEALVIFCSSFKYLRILANNQDASVTPEQKAGFPSICLTFMFDKKAHENARRIGTILNQERGPWRLFQAPAAITAAGEQLFTPQVTPGPMLGLKTDCPSPGVRISITFSQDLEAMERFYEVVTGAHGMPREDPKTGTSYRIYSIARNFELQLVYNSSVKVDTVDSVRVFIRVANQQSIAAELKREMSCVGSEHWETTDPVGTQVVLFTVVD